ncbi:hypothetical protein U1Q18_024066 [Sarracenia purpurea var. burkii]
MSYISCLLQVKRAKKPLNKLLDLQCSYDMKERDHKKIGAFITLSIAIIKRRQSNQCWKKNPHLKGRICNYYETGQWASIQTNQSKDFLFRKLHVPLSQYNEGHRIM